MIDKLLDIFLSKSNCPVCGETLEFRIDKFIDLLYLNQTEYQYHFCVLLDCHKHYFIQVYNSLQSYYKYNLDEIVTDNGLTIAISHSLKFNINKPVVYDVNLDFCHSEYSKKVTMSIIPSSNNETMKTIFLLKKKIAQCLVKPNVDMAKIRKILSLSKVF